MISLLKFNLYIKAVPVCFLCRFQAAIEFQALHLPSRYLTCKLPFTLLCLAYFFNSLYRRRIQKTLSEEISCNNRVSQWLEVTTRYLLAHLLRYFLFLFFTFGRMWNCHSSFFSLAGIYNNFLTAFTLKLSIEPYCVSTFFAANFYGSLNI